jgi:hypothetical protein
MLEPKHFFFQADHRAILRFGLPILSLMSKSEYEIAARCQGIRVLRVEHFFSELDHRAFLRFGIGMLALTTKNDRQIIACC